MLASRVNPKPALAEMINWPFIREVGPFRWSIRYSTLQFHKRILKKDSTLVLPTGSRITLPRQSRTSTEIYVTNANMDWGSEALFARFADRQRDFLDIGSHIGYYAAYLAPLVRRVYAFEPDSRNFTGLSANADASPNIEIVRMAVSSRNGTASFFTGPNSSVGSLDDHGGPATEVAVTTIDAFATNHAGIDVGLIKTDIEGHDLEALRGMQKTVAEFQPVILTECDINSELMDLCLRWNFRIFAFLKEKDSRRICFKKVEVMDAEKYWSKMLFLVPERLQSSIDSLAEASRRFTSR